MIPVSTGQWIPVLPKCEGFRYLVGMDDYSGLAAGLGIGAIIFGLVIYLGVIALTLWIGYLIMRTAVKNGILRADAERAAQRPGGTYGAPPQGGPAVPPQHR